MVMSRHLILPAEPQHLRQLAARLRDEDRREVESVGWGATKALWRSYRGSVYARTAYVDGEIAAVWGVGGSALGGLGRPWLLTAAPIERVPLTFVREGCREVAVMLGIYPHLRGIVAPGYNRAIRFLECLGFSVSSAIVHLDNQAPFRVFEMRREKGEMREATE